MNIKALITSLVLGSSSVALAAPSHGPSYAATPTGPVQVRDHRAPMPAPVLAPVVRDHRDLGGRFQARPGASRWVTLASSKKVNGRAFMTVGARAATFSTLQLEARRGTTTVTKVAIQFTDGRTQLVNLNRTVTARSPIRIDLAGNQRAIRRIMVYGIGRGYASITVRAI